MTTDAQDDSGVKLGLVGYGRWGRVWARVLDSLGMLCWIVDLDEKAQARARYEYPHATVHGELPLWELPYTAGAVIATPPEHHVVPALALLDQDIPLIVEKPFATTEWEANEIRKRAEKRGVRLFVDHTFMWSQAVVKALHWTKNKVGKVRHARYHWQNISTERGEDALWNLGPHALSVCLALAWVQDTRPDEFLVRGAYSRREGKADVVDLTIQMEDGSLHSFHLANFGAEKVREFCVVGETGAVVCRPTQHEALFFPAGGTPGESETFFQEHQRPEPLSALVQRFVDPRQTDDEFGQVGVQIVSILELLTNTLQTTKGPWNASPSQT